MRKKTVKKKDKKKNSFDKIVKSINFDKIVLEKLEDKARKEGTSVSNIVNMHIRRIVLSDVEWCRAMAKDHFLEFQKYKYLSDQAKIEYETKSI